jgi:hypothetical protein
MEKTSFDKSLIVFFGKQHGFRSGRSCLTQLLHHFDVALESLTNNSDFDSIYLDYTKAFDKVDHKLLIRKLAFYGIHPKIIKWIESFLSDRKQAVVVDGHLSLLAAIISGCSPRYCSWAHPLLDIHQRHRKLHHAFHYQMLR